jgi:hypothetical protein
LVSGSISVLPELLGVGTGGLFDWVLAVLFMVFVQPIAEELVFRGVTLPRLRHTFGAWAGIAMTAALYSIFHFVMYGDRLFPADRFGYGVLNPLLLGIFFSVIRVYTGSTRAAIVAHMGAGIFSVLTALVVVI